MAEPIRNLNVSVRLRNPKAIAALLEARETAEEMAENQPWSEDAKRIAKAIRRAIKSLKIKIG